MISRPPISSKPKNMKKYSILVSMGNTYISEGIIADTEDWSTTYFRLYRDGYIVFSCAPGRMLIRSIEKILPDSKQPVIETLT